MNSQISTRKLGYVPISLPFASVISALLLLTVAFEHIPLPIQANVLPLTSVLAVMCVPFILQRIIITPLLKVMMLFVIFIMFHSLIALYIDVVILNSPGVRVLAWTRQVIALGGGLSIFFILRCTLSYVSDRFIIYALLIGLIPALFFALGNVAWSMLGIDSARSIVAIRSAFDLRILKRSSGLSLEPAHFAFYLTTIAIPVAICAICVLKRKLLWIGILGAIAIAFAGTMSNSGVLIFIAFLLAGTILGPKRGLYFFGLSMVCGFMIAVAIMYPETYMANQIEKFVTGNWGLSIMDRFYSTIGPFASAFSSYSLLGYGLGGTATHFTEFIPDVAIQYVSQVTWESMTNLRTLFGRLFAETGLLGLSLFLLVAGMGIRQVSYIALHTDSNERTFFIKISRLAIIAYLVGGSIGHGSFVLPYFWFWLAFIDSRFQITREKIAENTERSPS